MTPYNGIDVYANDEPGDPNPGVIVDVTEWNGKALTPDQANELAQRLVDVALYMKGL